MNLQVAHTIFYLSALLLLLPGCAEKEEVVYQKNSTNHQRPPSTIQPTQVTPIVVQRASNIFAKAKTMKFPTLNGKIITIKGDNNLLKVTNPQYQGKEVVLYLFGRDCPHCVREIKQIKTLSRKPHIKVIGLHAQKMIGDKALKAYARQIGYNFDILSFKNDIIMIRYLKKNGLWYGGTPTHLLIESGGNVQDISIAELLNR